MGYGPASCYTTGMTTMNATELAKNLGHVLDLLERGGDEIVVTRNDQPVARLLPGAPRMTALEAMMDLHGVLSDEDGQSWLKDVAAMDRVDRNHMRDPWAS